METKLVNKIETTINSKNVITDQDKTPTKSYGRMAKRNNELNGFSGAKKVEKKLRGAEEAIKGFQHHHPRGQRDRK